MTILDNLAAHAASEEHASRAYRALANWCDIGGWVGCAKFYRKESADEMKHAMAFEEYAIDRGTTVYVKDQKALPTNPGSMLVDTFQAALDLERKVLAELNALSKQAMDEQDWDAVRFLNDYLKVGVESIRDLEVYVIRLNKSANDTAALFAFDDMIGG